MPLTTPKREERYRQLLQAAVKIFARDGIDAASVADIAEAAGVAKGSVYLYFDNKEILAGDMLGYLFSFADGGDRLGNEARPLERIAEFCGQFEQRVLSLGESAPVVLHMLAQTGKSGDSELARRVRQLLAESRMVVEVLLHRAREIGRLAQERPARELAGAVLGLTLGLVLRRVSGGGTDSNGMTAPEAVRVLLRGLGAQPEN